MDATRKRWASFDRRHRALLKKREVARALSRASNTPPSPLPGPSPPAGNSLASSSSIHSAASRSSICQDDFYVKRWIRSRFSTVNMHVQLHDLKRSQCYDDVKEMFNLMDMDKNGSIDMEELSTALDYMGFSKSVSLKIMLQADEDGSGTIEFEELAHVMLTNPNFGDFLYKIEDKFWVRVKDSNKVFQSGEESLRETYDIPFGLFLMAFCRKQSLDEQMTKYNNVDSSAADEPLPGESGGGGEGGADRAVDRVVDRKPLMPRNGGPDAIDLFGDSPVRGGRGGAKSFGKSAMTDPAPPARGHLRAGGGSPLARRTKVGKSKGGFFVTQGNGLPP